jgi:Kef-type K+ transport system membrane component KefB
MNMAQVLLMLVAVLMSAKILGEIAERFRQPAVLGELLAGVILGGSLLGIVQPEQEVVHVLAEIGVMLLLFEIGLETDLKRLLAVGPVAMTVACAGVILPFALGVLVARAFDLGLVAALVAGAALTATSVGITARVLSDLGRLKDPEGQVVLGAAVIDDVLGLIILAVIARLVSGGTVGMNDVLWSTGTAFGFLALSLVVAPVLIPRLFALLARIGREQTLPVMGLCLAFLLAVAAESAGSAMIVGAFTAGLVLQPTREAPAIRAGTVRLGQFFVPIFFVAVGAAVDARAFGEPGVLMLGLSLLAVAIVGKVLAGYAPWWFRGRKLLVGVAMVPRGEVGLIFAQMGLTAGAISVSNYSALMVTIMGTTFFTPPVLKALVQGSRGAVDADVSGLTQLVTEA